MKSSTDTLASAMMILSRDIQCEDGVATAAIAEAATRLLEQRDEIATLKEAIRRIADQDATLSVVGGNVIVEMNFTLTDAEREAVAVAANWCETPIDPVHSQTSLAAQMAAETLRGLLERTK